MPSGFPTSGRVRRFFKRVAYSVKRALRPGVPAPVPEPSRPPPLVLSDDSPSPLAGPSEPVTPLPQHPLPQSRQSGTLPQSLPNASESAPTILNVATDSTQVASAEPRLAMTSQKAGEEAWAGLGTTLRLLERSPDIFPAIKSAVAEFLGVVGIFEASGLV